MAKDRLIDPVTKDYIKNSTGGYETTETVGTQVYHQLVGKLNLWWGDSEAGSKLHLIKDVGAGAAGIAFAEDATRTALEKFKKQGLIRDIRVEVEAIGNKIFINASVIDIQGASVSVDGVTPFTG